uniref:uncharacterized protein LOC122601278 n=1 Tax=Erigeron canadensis TaxID=72917 RepID=UPI001CB90FA6|nr:uncharacterized protein LOC122601278 [Erigeron canadensis]
MEGGLGVHSLFHFNVALMATHIWNLLTRKESLWRQPILELEEDFAFRPLVRQFFWSKLGNGRNTSAWFDNWSESSPLYNHLSVCLISNATYNSSDMVAELITFQNWNWSSTWLAILPNASVPALTQDKDDKLCWRNRNGVLLDFSISQAWEVIRPRAVEIAWYHVVWFAHCVSKYSFHLWLLMKCKLKMQDILRPWDVSPTTPLVYALCDGQPDSHTRFL